MEEIQPSGNLRFIAPNVAALIMLILAIYSVIVPAKMSEILGLSPARPLGKSEFRATYGGFFAALAVTSVFYQSPASWTVLGVAWLFAGLVRVASIYLDSSYSMKNVFGILVQVALGLLFLVGNGRLL